MSRNRIAEKYLYHTILNGMQRLVVNVHLERNEIYETTDINILCRHIVLFPVLRQAIGESCNR